MIDTGELIGRLALGALLGSVIGLEREKRAWTAGLRTHMMVCLGATLIMEVSAFGFNDIVQKGLIVLDPSRIAAQVVSGIGFLGAGTIVFLRNEVVKGLTTAAGLWAVAGIGLATGAGMYLAAVATTGIAILILLVLRQVEERYCSKNKFKSIRVSIKREHINLQQIEDIMKTHHVRFTEINVFSNEADNLQEVKVKVQKDFGRAGKSMAMIEELSQLKGVTEVNFFA